MFELLKGITVLDLSTVVFGPFASQMLADFGADVIKIESPDGDIFRAAAPARSPRMGAGYLNLNRNKRSLSLDLKTAEGRAALDRLVADADVLLHNMRPKAIERLDLGYERLAALNERLIYCAAVGFGSDGPYANDPAYDDVIQSMTGFASMNIDPEAEPQLLPTILTDKVAGLYALAGILGALLSRERTGRGMAVEAAMFESLASFMLIEHLSGHVFEPAEGTLRYDRLTSPHRRPHRTADGYIAALPYSTRHWVKFLRLIGRDDLADADWVCDASRRSERIGELYAVLAEATPARTSAEWLTEFRRLDIPCGPVNRLEDLLDDPHLAAVDFFQRVDHPTEGAINTVRQPLRFLGAPSHTDIPAPRLGVDGRKVLHEYGMGDATIDNLVAAGALYLPQEHDSSHE
ncbi:CoA-transferase family III family protein 44 [Salinisphaera shabanensis T35B1]|uniref:CaiB/BaiF CoA transferase family protein n=1 Tax=Salinisphaera shabanensis TaxID=180542 RepID=UPI00333FFC38